MENNTAQMLARIEKLESMVLRRGGGGGIPGSTQSFAGPIVANQAAAKALNSTILPNGEAVLTLAQDARWVKIAGTPGTVGVPPLAADEVLLMNDGTGVIARDTWSSPRNRIGVNDIYIDPANGAASNENSGLTPGAPLKTGYELFRRWGWGATQPIVGPNLATSPDGFLTIHVMSNIVSPDSLPLKVIVATNGSLRIRGNTPTVIATGTLTDAVVAMNPAAPAPGGTRLTIRDNAIAGWGAAELPNRRVQMVDGPAAGGTFQPQTDAVATPGQVQCSACQTTNEPGFSLTPTTVTPAVGNTYHIQSLTVVNLGDFEIAQEQNPAFSSDVFVNIVDCNLPNVPGQNWAPICDGGIQGPSLNLYQCTIDRDCDVTSARITFIACYFTASLTSLAGKGFVAVLQGGGLNNLSGLRSINFNAQNTNVIIDNDFVANKLNLFVVCGAVRNFASWNAQATGGGINTAGHGFLVGGGGTSAFFGSRGACSFKGTLWGSGNAGAGMLIAAACNGVGAPQNITGVGQGDLKLANNNNGFWFNDATGIYNPIPGGLALSWAGLLAAEGAAGFGGNAHDPDSNSHFVASETTA